MLEIQSVHRAVTDSATLLTQSTSISDKAKKNKKKTQSYVMVPAHYTLSQVRFGSATMFGEALSVVSVWNTQMVWHTR